MIPFAIIVATDAASGIGKAGGMAWRLPPDLRYFRAVTTGPGGLTNAVIMGRRTWESLPARFRPLTGRLNVVLSRTPSALDLPAGVSVAGSLDEALALGAGCAHRFVIGGAEVYRQALARADCARLIVTRLEATFDCDASFPPIPPDFRLASEAGPYTHGGLTYRLQRWVRRSPET